MKSLVNKENFTSSFPIVCLLFLLTVALHWLGPPAPWEQGVGGAKPAGTPHQRDIGGCCGFVCVPYQTGEAPFLVC